MGRVGFTQKLVSAPRLLNSRKDGKMERRKDGVFLWEVEELTFLIIRSSSKQAIFFIFFIFLSLVTFLNGYKCILKLVYVHCTSGGIIICILKMLNNILSTIILFNIHYNIEFFCSFSLLKVTAKSKRKLEGEKDQINEKERKIEKEKMNRKIIWLYRGVSSLEA